MTNETLLFEIGTEELPPASLRKLATALLDGFCDGLDKAGLSYGNKRWFATPRRLAVEIEDVPLKQPDRRQEKRGPAVQAAFDADGNPSKAAEGFARSCGVSVEELGRLKTDKGEWLAYAVEEAGKSAQTVLPGIADAALAKLPIAKRMRWGSGSAEFVRPVHWIVFLLGSDIVPCSILDVESGNQSYGHRFMSPFALSIYSPESYLDTLKDVGHVIADFSERRAQIRAQVESVATTLGGQACVDDDLLEEVTSLVEWPEAISGSFDPSFLEVPNEALIMTMKKNQKYFYLLDDKQQLMPNFITISNVKSEQPHLIAEGNERVIRPRLADARFFWEQDAKQSLEQHLASLKQVVFQKDLGSLYEKTERVANLSVEIARILDAPKEQVHRAAILSRCDLMTEMVNEFPDMQGIMGRYQAARDGESDDISLALDEFYMPRFAADQLPSSSIGKIIALADRIDTLVGIFGIGQKPSGVKDPFGLRRAAIAVLRIMLEGQLDLDLYDLLCRSAETLQPKIKALGTVDGVFDYIQDRMKGIYLDHGYSNGEIEAVIAIHTTRPLDFRERIAAVKHFKGLPESEALASANKRISNLLKKSGQGDSTTTLDPQLFEFDAEEDLYQAVQSISAKVSELIERRNYKQALTELASLRAAVDRYFDDVMVMSEDEKLRLNRLTLLSNVHAMFIKVADISRLEVKS